MKPEKRYTLKFWKADMGSFEQPGCVNNKDALWHVNNAREHDNLKPIKTLREGMFKFVPE